MEYVNEPPIKVMHMLASHGDGSLERIPAVLLVLMDYIMVTLSMLELIHVWAIADSLLGPCAGNVSKNSKYSRTSQSDYYDEKSVLVSICCSRVNTCLL